MPTDIIQIVANSSPAVAVCAMFLWYLIKTSKLEEKKHEQFIKAISGNTSKIGSVEKKVEKVDRKVDKIQEDHKESQEIIKKMYKHAVEAYKGKNGTITT